MTISPASSQTPTPPPSQITPAIEKAAKDFEAVFITQMLAPMFNTVSTDGYFGGGQAEESWRGVLMDEYGKMMVNNGGIGLSDAIAAEMLKLQENAR
jgi:peptidoglycan hydrolase FlgJ